LAQELYNLRNEGQGRLAPHLAEAIRYRAMDRYY
jgi:hypothetical protein